VIERHLIAIGFIAGEGAGLRADPKAAGRLRGAGCPACGSPNIHRVEGCATCADCGHSKCSG